MAGNALGFVTPTTLDPGDIIIKGGGWYYGTVGPLIANRQSFKSQYKDARVGLRLCALPLPADDLLSSFCLLRRFLAGCPE